MIGDCEKERTLDSAICVLVGFLTETSNGRDDQSVTTRWQAGRQLRQSSLTRLLFNGGIWALSEFTW